MRTSGRARVVIADDHPRVRDAVITIISPFCDVVASVSDGAAAIDATSKLHPDVVVLDVAMPGLDGFQTASRIAASHPGARIVFLSNYVGDDYVLAGMTRGASAFVSKARMARDLVAAIEHALEGRAFVPSAAILPRWRRRGGRRHDLLLYESDAFLADAVTAYFISALQAGHSLVAIMTDAHRGAIEARLKAHDVDLEALATAGRYTASDERFVLEAISRDEKVPPDIFETLLEPVFARALAAARGPAPHVSLFGEGAPILGARGQFDASLLIERYCDEYAAVRPLSILCGYSTSAVGDHRSGAGALICGEHSTVVPADAEQH